MTALRRWWWRKCKTNAKPKDAPSWQMATCRAEKWWQQSGCGPWQIGGQRLGKRVVECAGQNHL
eukprot:2328332-Lingulodinium_polyedra.AAC.1